MTSKEIIAEFNQRHIHTRSRDCEFIQKLQAADLTDDQIALCIQAMDETCPSCRDSDNSCHCNNDE